MVWLRFMYEGDKMVQFAFFKVFGHSYDVLFREAHLSSYQVHIKTKHSKYPEHLNCNTIIMHPGFVSPINFPHCRTLFW